MESTTQTIAVQSQPAEHQGSANILNPDVTLMILTWVTFFALLAILYKFTWKPILTALQNREDLIRQSLDDARKAQEQLTHINQLKVQILDEAKQKADTIIEQSRKSAQELAISIEAHAKEHGQALIQSALAEIEGQKQKAITQLKEESANIAVELAEKIIQENLSTDKNRRLIEQYLKEI